MSNITQAQFLRQYNETHREEFNPEFFKRDNDEIISCMKKVIMSCERDKYFTLKVLDIKEIYSYEEIINILKDHNDKHKKKSSKEENPYDYINIKESDIMLLQVKYFIRHNGTEIQKINDKDMVVKDPWEIMDVLIALPRFTKKYYFRLNGNYYSDIFQIVDGSTYNNSTNGSKSKKTPCNTFKTIFTPIRMFRHQRDMVDVNTKTVIHNTAYTCIVPIVYNTCLHTLLYLFANYGWYGCRDFLGIYCVEISDQPIKDPNWYCFEKHGIYISYPIECYNDPMVQTMAACIYDSIDNDTELWMLYDIRYWLKRLGKCFKNETIDKGLAILDSLDGTFDIITQETLHLPEEEKKDIYYILRWMMREFNAIRNKNNVDVTLKRYRIGEPIASVYAAKMIKGLSRVSDLGKKVTLNSVHRAIYTSPLFVINGIITMSNLIAYRDMVTDNDATLALKYTYKGVSGLGDSGTSIQKIYRYVDPSHVGILDLDSSTTSDPGMSGTICPMAKVYPGNCFSEYEEPNSWNEDFKYLQDEYLKDKVKGASKPISFTKELPSIDITKSRKDVISESLNIDRVRVPIRNIDPSIDYSSAGSIINQSKDPTKKEEIQSMFTIKADNDPLDDVLYEDNGEDYL